MFHGQYWQIGRSLFGGWRQGVLWLSLGLMGLSACSREVSTAFVPSLSDLSWATDLTYPAFLQDPQTAERYRQEGLSYRQAGSWDAAIATLKIAAALDPLNPNSYVILGWTQHLAGNHSMAAQSLQTALQQNPSNVPALNALGIVYLVSGDLQAAVQTHTRAAELEANNEIAHYNLSLTYERLGKAKDAIAQAQTATQLEPDNPHPWVALALAHWASGDQAQAKTIYQQAVEIDGRYRSRSHLATLEKAGFSLDQIQRTELLRQASLGG